jgi:hypothetical protein
MTNYVDGVDTFKIIQKLNCSDHCPLEVRLCIPRTLSLEFLKTVADGHLSYEHHDNSRIIKPKLTLKNIDTENLSGRFNELAELLDQKMEIGDMDSNSLAILMNDKLYEACNRKYKRKIKHVPEEKKHLTSHNFHAIADANLRMYTLSLQRDDDPATCDVYYQLWEVNQAYAYIKEKEEYNVRANTSWKYTAKNDPKKLWKKIDYKDKNNKSQNEKTGIEEGVILDYFKGIYQNERLEKNPTIEDVKDSLDTYNMYVPVLDDNFTMDELDRAIAKNGAGIGLDGLDKKIAILFSKDLRSSILELFNRVYSTTYPEIWTKQLLRPETKKGHTKKNPKMRGLAISQLLPTLYDIMLFNRFNQWYCPNAEQASAPKQGCILQIFSIYVMMEYLKSIGKTLYIGFLDYEKAFDFISRGHLITHLQEKGAGAKFVRAIASMYTTTLYVPKMCNRAGEAIVAKHGVMQGRQTSSPLFSFEVHEMGKSINQPASIINETNLLQLADDSGLLTEGRVLLQQEFGQCLQFSADNFMSANLDKTVFLEASENNDTEPMKVGEAVIKPAENDEYVYLGMNYIASNEILKHIQRALKDRMFHVSKFYDWLLINEATPVTVKLNVLYVCMFNAYLYAVEAWWKIDDVSKRLLLLERKLLRCILCVKSNTPDDVLYLEFNRHDLIAWIKHRQRNFFQNLLQLRDDEAVARRIVTKYRHLPLFEYYDNIDPDVLTKNKEDRLSRVHNATTTYLQRYTQLIDTTYNHVIYDSYIPEYLRIVITRWRLSNHELKIETGRRETPFVPRALRLCTTCGAVEDEEHVVYNCPLYDTIRVTFREFLTKYPEVTRVFNPENVDDARELGRFLIAIEKERKRLGLQQE